jgi:autotransporter-associated beta strand protein
VSARAWLAGLLLAAVSGSGAAWQGVESQFLVPPPWSGCAGARGWGTIQRIVGTNSYTGSTTVAEGTLIATPLASSAVTVAGAAMLCVTGWSNSIAASRSTGSGTTGITWWASAAGTAGNSITVRIVADPTAGITATAAVAGSAVTVTRQASATALAVANAVVATTNLVQALPTDGTGAGIPAAVGPVALTGGVNGTGAQTTTWSPPANTALTFTDPDAPTVPLAVNGTLVRPTGGTVSVSLSAGYPRRGWPVQLINGTLSGTWAPGTLPASTYLLQTAAGLWLAHY